MPGALLWSTLALAPDLHLWPTWESSVACARIFLKWQTLSPSTSLRLTLRIVVISRLEQMEVSLAQIDDVDNFDDKQVSLVRLTLQLMQVYKTG